MSGIVILASLAEERDAAIAERDKAAWVAQELGEENERLRAELAKAMSQLMVKKKRTMFDPPAQKDRPPLRTMLS